MGICRSGFAVQDLWMVVIIAVINTMMVTYGDIGTVMIDQKLIMGISRGHITLGFMKLPWKVWAAARIPMRWHHAGSCRPGPFQDTSPPGTAHVSRNAVYLCIAFTAKTDHTRVCFKDFSEKQKSYGYIHHFQKTLVGPKFRKKSDPESVDHVSTFWTF